MGDTTDEQRPLLSDGANDETGAISYGSSASSPEDAVATHKSIAVIFAGFTLPIFLGSFDGSAVNTNYAQIATGFKSLDQAPWIATSFFLAMACTQPIWGKLSDVVGRKSCLMGAYLLFLVGTLGCGFAPTMGSFIAARACQGLAAGGIMIVTTVILNDLVSKRDRGNWQAYMNLIGAIGMSAGAPLGGLIADTLGWRWTFIGQAPLMVVAIVIVYILMQLPASESTGWRQKLRELDLLGAVLLTGSIFVLLISVDRGSQHSFRDPIAFITFALAPLLLLVFVVVEKKFSSAPLLPPSKAINRSVFSVWGLGFFSYGSFSALQFYTPLYYQARDGVSVSQTGLLMLPTTVMGMIGCLVAGWLLKRTGRFKNMMLISEVIATLSMLSLLLGTTIAAIDVVIVCIASTLTSFFFCVALTGSLLALITNIDDAYQAVLTAVMFTVRSLGSAISVSVIGTVIQSRFADRLLAELPSNVDAEAILRQVRGNLDIIPHLQPSVQAVVRDCYGEALQWGFAIMVGLFAMSAVMAIGIKGKKIED